MDIAAGTRVCAQLVGHDGSLIAAPDHPFPPSDRVEKFLDVKGFDPDPDTDVISIEPVEGRLDFRDYARGTRYVVVTDDGGCKVVDPETIEAL